ncbi:uncharacterized protein A1O9_10212 [Exophiala aquamarina CBS 119918]|uniref:MmgE/PrpD C-terminal domain-containing protein n=1 Tax=Exophiala aquamarina CBS 119918 TaxID=1182545 RepID=A0A072P1X0_9EURO|nr:uncharacterized protein A1O9_10212 [Exophiala aquamarina CBS 119918]KEF53811.1 hypothetical protein A1O9_10212 [Exophiala aquamarina CBS 119918]
MAGQMGIAAGNNNKVRKIRLYMTPANHSMVGERSVNKLHPENIVDAQFSAYYQTVIAWLHGSTTGLETYDRLGQPELNSFCEKLECVIYPDKNFGKFASTIETDYEDGSHDPRDMDRPLRDQVELKFFSLVERISGEKRATEIRDVIDGIHHASIAKLLRLVE